MFEEKLKKIIDRFEFLEKEMEPGTNIVVNLDESQKVSISVTGITLDEEEEDIIGRVLRFSKCLEDFCFLEKKNLIVFKYSI